MYIVDYNYESVLYINDIYTQLTTRFKVKHVYILIGYYK